MKDYKIEVLSRGGCIDREGGNLYQIDTYSLRVSPEALNDYMWSKVYEGPWEEDYETQAAYLAQKEAKIKAREQWERDVLRAIGITAEPRNVNISRVVSEFFAIVYIREIDSRE